MRQSCFGLFLLFVADAHRSFDETEAETRVPDLTTNRRGRSRIDAADAREAKPGRSRLSIGASAIELKTLQSEKAPDITDELRKLPTSPTSSLVSGLALSVYSGYFADSLTWFESASLVSFSNVPASSFISPVTSIAWSITGQVFSSVYKGYFTATESGTWGFQTESDDSSWLWLGSADESIDNLISTRTAANALVNNGGLHGAATVSGSKSLVSGSKYPILVYYGDGGTSGTLTVSFKEPSSGQWSIDGSSYYTSNPVYFESTSGSCTVSGDCFYSPNYPSEYGNGDSCAIKANYDLYLNVKSYALEGDGVTCSYDFLTIGGILYCGAIGPANVFVPAGGQITFSTDGSVVSTGWEICYQNGAPSSKPTPMPTSAPSTGPSPTPTLAPSSNPSPGWYNRREVTATKHNHLNTLVCFALSFQCHRPRRVRRQRLYQLRVQR